MEEPGQVGLVPLGPLHEPGVGEELEPGEGVEPVHLDVELEPLRISGAGGARQPERVAQVAPDDGELPEDHVARLRLGLHQRDRRPGDRGVAGRRAPPRWEWAPSWRRPAPPEPWSRARSGPRRGSPVPCRWPSDPPSRARCRFPPAGPGPAGEPDHLAEDHALARPLRRGRRSWRSRRSPCRRPGGPPGAPGPAPPPGGGRGSPWRSRRLGGGLRLRAGGDEQRDEQERPHGFTFFCAGMLAQGPGAGGLPTAVRGSVVVAPVAVLVGADEALHRRVRRAGMATDAGRVRLAGAGTDHERARAA